ncbi:mucin-17-like isoform X3 [Scylla paramamosain]|uniref:mucin-17-like isoform X3 n=1 Tax=Scylla paramamosain TaxID=85552 RepID=UPI0030837975
MALQWRETSFLPTHSASRVRVPIDFEIEEPEEELDFILEVETAIEPTRVEISEGSSSTDNEDEAQITVLEVRPDTGAGAAKEATPVTLEQLQNEIHMMQNEARALRDLISNSESSAGEVVQDAAESWQQRDVFESVRRRAEAGMIAVDVTSNTSQVVFHRQYTEQVVTHQRSPSKQQRRSHGNNSSHSSYSGSSPESPRLRELRPVTHQTAVGRTTAETHKDNEIVEGASKDDNTLNLPSITNQVPGEVVRTEPDAEEGDGDDSYAETQTTEQPLPVEPAEEDSATDDSLMEGRVMNEPIRGPRVVHELRKQDSVTDQPIRMDSAKYEVINQNTIINEPNREDAALENTTRRQSTQGEANRLVADFLSPEEPDDTDANNGRRSRSSYHNMVEEMGISSSEDNLSDEWNEEDFADEVNNRSTNDSPGIGEATEFTHLTVTETGSDLAIEKPEEQESSEISGEMKASGIEMEQTSPDASEGEMKAVKVKKERTSPEVPEREMQTSEVKGEGRASPEVPEKEKQTSEIKQEGTFPEVPEGEVQTSEAKKEGESPEVLERDMKASEVKNERMSTEVSDGEAKAPAVKKDSVSLEIPEVKMKASGVKKKKKKHKSSLGVETVVKPYLETNLDNPVLFYLEKEAESKSSAKSESSGEGSDKTSELDILKSDTEKEQQVEETANLTLENVKQHELQTTLEHITKERKPEPLYEFKQEAPTEVDNQEVLSDLPPNLVGQSESKIIPQSEEQSHIAASNTTTPPAAGEDPGMESTQKTKRRGKSWSRKRPTQKPPLPPSRPASLTPNLGLPSFNIDSSTEERSPCHTRSLSYTGSSSPHPETPPRSLNSSLTSLESESAATEDAVQLRERPSTDDPTLEGLKRVSAVYEELEMIPIPQVPPPPPKDKALLKPESPTSNLEIEASVSASPEVTQTQHIVCLPNTSEEPVKEFPQILSIASPSVSLESTSGPVSDSNLTEAQNEASTEGSKLTPSRNHASEESMPSSLEHFVTTEDSLSPPPAVVNEPDSSSVAFTPQKQGSNPSVDSDSLMMESLETPSPILSESPSVILPNLEKTDIPEIPPPPPRRPPPTVVSQTLPSPSAEVPSAQKDEDASAQPVSMPLAQMLFDLEKMEIPGVPPPPPRHPPPPPPPTKSRVLSTAEITDQENAEASLPVSEICSLPANENSSQPLKDSSDESSHDSEAHSTSALLQGSAETPEKIFEKLKKIEIPEVPPPPPIQPPPLITSQTSPPQLCGSSSILEDDSPTELKATPADKYPSHTSRALQEEEAEALSPDLLRKLEEIEIPEVPPPPPRQPPPATSGVMETLPIQMQEMSSDKILETMQPQKLNVNESPGSQSPPGQTTETAQPQSSKSCDTLPPDQKSPEVPPNALPMTLPQVTSLQRLKELEGMEIPEVPPPPPRQPPPQMPDVPHTPQPSEALSICCFQHSPPGMREATPSTSPDVYHSGGFDLVQKLLESTETPDNLSMSSEASESSARGANLDASSAKMEKPLPLSPIHGALPCMAEISPSNLIEDLERIEIPEVPPPPPRRPPPPPPRQSSLSQQPLPSPRFSKSDAQFPQKQMSGLASSCINNESPVSHESFPVQIPAASPVIPLETSTAEDSNTASLSMSTSQFPLQQMQAAPNYGNDSPTTQPPKMPLTQLPELPNSDILLTSSPGILSSSVLAQQVPDAYLAQVFENSRARLPSGMEEIAEEPAQDLHLSYARLHEQFLPSEEETTSSSGDSSSSEEEHSLSEDEGEVSSSSSQDEESSSASEEDVPSVSEPQVSLIPEIQISFAPENQLTSDEEQEAPLIAEETSFPPEQPTSSMLESMDSSSSEEVVASLPEETVSSVPEYTVFSVPEDTVASVPEKTVASTPEETVASVPEKTVAFVPEKTAASLPEETVASVSEKMVASVSEKTVASVPEETVASVSEKMVASAPEEMVVSVPEETVASVPEETVTSVPEETVASVSEKTVTSVPEETVASVPEETVASVPEETVTSVPKETVASVPEETVASVPEKEVASLPEKKVASVPEKKVVSVPEKTVASVPEKTVASVPEKTVASLPEKKVASVPEKKVVSVPEKTVASVPEKTVASVPEKTVASVPEKTVASVPEKTVASVPEKTVASLPEKTVASLPEKKVASVPEKEVVSLPEKKVASVPEKKVTSVPEKKVASVPEKEVASVPEKTVASVPEKEVASVPEKTVTSLPEKKVASVPEKTVASVLEKTVASVLEKTVASVPEKTVASVPEKEVASVPEKTVTSVPEKKVASVPEEVSSVPEKEVSSVPEKEVASLPEKEVASVPEKMVTSVPDKTVASVPEKEVASLPEKEIASVPEKTAPSLTQVTTSVSGKNNGNLPEEADSSMPEKVVASSLREHTSFSREESISSSPEEKVSFLPEKNPAIPEITISFAPETEFSYVSEEEQEIFSAPEKVPSLIEQDASPATENISSESKAEQVSSVLHHSASTQAKILETTQEDSLSDSSPSNDSVAQVKETLVYSPPKCLQDTASTEAQMVEDPLTLGDIISPSPETTSPMIPKEPSSLQGTPHTTSKESSPSQATSHTTPEEPFALQATSHTTGKVTSPLQATPSTTPPMQVTPKTTQIKPSVPQAKPNVTQTKPPQSQVKPNTTQTKPPSQVTPYTTQTKPPLPQTKPNTTQTKPTLPQTKPNIIQTKPLQQATPYTTQTKPPLPQTKPNTTQTKHPLAQTKANTTETKPQQQVTPNTTQTKPPLPLTKPNTTQTKPPPQATTHTISKEPLPTQAACITTQTKPFPWLATSSTTLKESSPPQPSEATHVPPGVPLIMQQGGPSADSFPKSTTVKVMNIPLEEAATAAEKDEKRKEKKEKEEEEEKEEDDEGRKRAISQSSEETEEEYFTPPSESPPYSPRQEKKKPAFGEFSFVTPECLYHREGAGQTVEFVTWGHELEVVLDPSQSPRDEEKQTRHSHSPPDMGKRHCRHDETTLPSTKRRRLSCDDDEDDLKNILAVCRVRSRSSSPSGHRVSRITQAIGEALGGEETEKSYEILVKVSVMAPSQSTSPESRIRISAQMRSESPTPPTDRPPRLPHTPSESTAVKEDPERHSVRPKVKRNEKDGPLSPSNAASPPLSPLSRETGPKTSKEKSKREKSRDKRSRKQKEFVDDSKTAVTGLKEGEKEEKEEEEENEAAKRAMMEFCVHNLSSDTDSDASTSSTTSSTSSSDDDCEDDGRSYQVTAPGEVGLATIEEDAEEDSGAESSGHWMFSADNTDTDSVIHVPAALTPAPVEPPRRHPPEDGESTASDETLVVEDDEEDEKGVCGGDGEGRGGRQEAGVTVGNSLARTPATTPAAGGHYDSSASEDEHGSQGTERPAGGSSLRVVHRRRRKPGDGRPAGTGASLQQTNMLGPSHATRIFEKHVDDVFDFESLESCESVSGGSEASSPGHPGSLSGLEEPDAVFNMSATSQPFADSSPIVTDEAARITMTGVSPEVSGELEDNEGSSAPSLLLSEEARTLSLASTPSGTPAGGRGEEIEGDLNNVISNSDTDLVLPSTNSDGSQPPESSSGPQSMDMFGLPVRWTPGHDPRHAAIDTATTTRNNDTTYIEAEKTSVMQMRSDSDTETFANTTARPSNSSSSLVHHSEGRSSDAAAPREADLLPLPDGARAVSIDDVQVGSAVETMVACEAQQQEAVSAAAFTPYTTGENSSEARHCHSSHGPAHHHHISLAPLPQQSEGETLLLPPSCAANQDVNEDTMRDALLPPLLQGNTATKTAVGGVIYEQVTLEAPESKPADIHSSREAGYISSGLKSQPSRAITCGTDLPSGDSDTDTDNTDGDYDEEDHFAAELSLRISSMPAATATKVKSFRSSDILNLIGLERGGAGPREVGGVSDDVSPPASQAGSSPEVPDSLRSSEGPSATRSVETLSEDSGLGDRDVRLTPSSPLAPISEAAPSQAPATPSDAPVSSRPRRQDARQARIARARSLGDLRSYSDSDSEEEEGAMYRWQPHPAAHQLNEGMNGSSSSYRTQQRPYKPSYTNYLLQQQQQRCGADAASRLPPRPLPFSGSEGSDEELRSRFTNHRVISPGHSKPRRHKSFHEASRQDSTCWPAAEVGKGNWAAPHGAPRPGRRRPQPISVDLAEQFLSQEGLKSPQRKQTVENPYGAAGEGRGEEWRMQHPPSLPGTGGVAYQAARAAPANQKPPCEASTNGVCVGSVGSGSEQCPPASSLTPELTVLRAWPAAQAAPSLLATPSRPAPAPPCTRPPVPAPLPHQYSSTPAQLPNECQPVHTGRRSSSPTHDPPGTTDIELRAASDLNEQCLPGGTGVSPATPDGVTTEMAEGAMRVHTKTYGSHGEVEVYLAKCDNGCRPPNTSPVLTPRGGAEHRPGSRGVTFSPSVKEINWRESYYEAEPEGEGSGSDVRKVLVVTSESPTPQRVDLTPSPPPSHAPTTHSQDANNTPESSPAPPGGPPHDSDKSNGRVSQAPAGSSSDAEMGEDKSPKVQTPLWQRFKLPKISSPKSPRPKIPPKPQSLSSRSSDTESSKMSSPGMDSSSSTPSSPDIKTKKAPSSPRFFSWGSKREKKVRVLPPRPLVSPPPPPAQVNAGQRGEVTGVQGGVKGEPDPATAVSPAALPREDSAGVSDNSSEPVRQEAQRVSAPAREERVTRSPVRLVNADRPLIADSDGLSHGSGRSPLTSATSGEDSSDAGQQHSPRSALSKPPLPPHLQRPNQQVFHKARLLSARRQYFSQERQVSAPERSSPPKELPPPPPAPKPREVTQHIVASRYNSTFDASNNLKERFERFSASARAERERLARSTPDLSVIEASVRRQGPRIDLWSQSEQQQQQAESHPASPASASDGDAARPDLAHRGASSTHQKARAAIHERYKNRAQRIHARARSQNSGVLETDLDTGASREVLTLRETNLDDLYRDLQHLLESIPPVGAAPPQADKARAKSLLDLEATATMEAQLDTPARPPDTRAKSMEFLLDDGNKASIQPPENELMKGSERQLSEAELRVRRSLQRLDVPEWMKNAPPPQQGFLLRRRDYGSSSAPAGGWSAYSSKTASMTSLGSSRAVTPNTPTKVVIPTRVATRGVGGVGGVTSPASNCSISPSPSDRSGSLFQYPISRWSTSRLNSGTTTPTGSVTSSRTTATYTRQPYLGWRSQTSLANLAGSQSSLTSTGSYLTAADRLALGITAYSQRFVKPTPSTQDKENSSSEANAAAPKPENPEQNDTGSTNGSIKLQVPTDVADVHSSIKEVTSAIVHYCNESTPSPRASPRGSPRPDGRAPSPRRLVWVESSFVGSRPITSPETPTSSTHAITPTSQLNGHDLPESGEVPSRPPQPPGEPHSEPPTTTTTTTTTTHTPSRARTAQAQSHVHVDPSGRAPTTRRLDTLEAQGPEGTFTARQVTEADPSTGVLLHQSTAVVTHPHSHAYSAAPIPPAHTNLSQNAHISPTHHPRLSSPTSDSLTSHRNLLSSSSHNIVPPTPPSYTTPTTASRHVNTTFTHPTHSLSSTLPNCVITASPVPVNSHHTTLPQSHSRSAPSDTRPSHPPASSPRAGTSPGHTTRSNLHKGHHQPHVPGHFVPDSQGSGQVNQLGTSPPKRSSQEVVPASPADPLTEALMLSGVIAAVPSIVERQPPPPPPAGPRVTFHLPPRHMNIPPDSSSENGNGNENVRVDADDDSTSSNIVKCRNPSCGLTAETDEARSTFKTCHNCSTFYCSRACRRQHWERHKKQCKRISSLAVAKQVVARVREDEAVLERVSAVARRGIRALGRGTVKIFFHDIRGAETFVGGGELPETHYMTIQNLLPQETGPEVYKQITELCKHYNVEYKLVLYVSICIMNEIPTGSSPKWEREMVSHCAKLRLAGGTGGGGSDTWSPRPERHVITRDMDEPETMILTSAPIPESNTSPQAARHIAFNNIVRHLREKGISLRHQYPDVHKKLTAYVELGEVFPPLTIYPRDVTTGSTFMCIIMPETDHAKLQLLSNDASKVRTIDISRPHPPA